jgi:uncharacterized protein
MKGDLMSDFTSKLPARPSLEQLRKQAKDLLHAARAGDETAGARLRRARVRGADSDPTRAVLTDAQLVVARDYGFVTWADLVHHVRKVAGDASGLRPLIRPVELQGNHPFSLPDGTVVTTDEVFRMFVSARAGDLKETRALIARAPGLALVEYNYTPPIHFAVREGHLGIAEMLIERGANIAGYRAYPTGDSLLMLAEEREHWDVAAVLRQRLSRTFALGLGTQELIDAARSGDLARVDSVLRRDATLARKSNETGDTALHHAAQHASLKIVEALLAAGADPDAMRGDGYRPVHLTLMRNWSVGGPEDERAAIADALLARGARYTMFIAALRGDRQFLRDALARDRTLANEEDTCHHRPLSGAVRRGDLELARLLLERGADPNAPEEGAPRGHALWLAVHDRRVDLVRMLLEYGADPNGEVESSGRPIDQARQHPELFAMLRAHGGSGEPRTAREKLAALISERRFDEVERMVRDSPALLDDEPWRDAEGILMGPAHAADHEMLALLLRLGARVPLVSKWAPYYYFKHEATATFLLRHGMDPNHMNWHRYTLLHHMASQGELGKARLLVEHGARIDAIDDEYRSTPLALAARRGQRDVAALLLDRGADPEAAGAPWATPVAWALKRGHADVANMIRAAGP